MPKQKKIKNRRVFLRRSYRTEVVFEDEFKQGVFYVFSKDISIGGIFLENEIPIKKGTLVFLSFLIPPHKTPIRVSGEVVYMKKGIGVQFIGLNEIAKERLLRFLS